MTALTCTLTNAGRAALLAPGGGGTAAVQIVAAGITATAFTVAPTLTALPSEIKRLATISGVAIDATTIHLTIRDDSTDAYTARGIGLYLADGTLFAVYGQATPILGKAEASTFYLAADLKMLAGQASQVTFGNTNFINPPASETVKGVAYLAKIAEALAGAVADKLITPATMKAVLDNYVAATKLGAPNGVATLGPDGKLLVSQRPPIDLIDVFAVASQAAMLALAATVGDFAVRADINRVFVLQAAPATAIGNWLEISTPAPVSSVNGKLGTVVLNPADVGAVPVARSVTGAGLLAGQGGALGADRVFELLAANAAEALAGLVENKVLTPASLATILARLSASVPTSRTIGGSGLVTGGGALDADRALDVAVASLAEIVAGVTDAKAVTPYCLANLPKSLTPNGYYIWPGGFMMQWIQYRNVFTAEATVPITFPLSFTEMVLPQVATAFISSGSKFKDLGAQIMPASLGSGTVQLQASESQSPRADGFDIIIFGK